jgi:hypothetical protein
LALGILMGDTLIVSYKVLEWRNYKASLLVYKVFLARSKGSSVSNTALAMRFEEWRPGFEGRKYLVRIYWRHCFEKASQIIADDCKAIFFVSEYDFENNKSRTWTMTWAYQHSSNERRAFIFAHQPHPPLIHPPGLLNEPGAFVFAPQPTYILAHPYALQTSRGHLSLPTGPHLPHTPSHPHAL